MAAARRFRAAGGTHLFLATQNYGARVPRTLDDYARQFEQTEALGRAVAAETGATVYTVLAPYPIDLVHVAPEIGVPAAEALQRAALELAARRVRERAAVALGEVGRAHFPVPAEVGEAVERVFAFAAEVARETDCPLVVHSEDLDAAGYGRLAALARAHGLDPGRVVKHYARERVAPEDRDGVAASFLAKRDLVRSVLADGALWFLETDFLDDPNRPGAVLDLGTVPRRAAQVAERGAADADRLWVPFSESIERVYGFRPAPPEPGGA